MSGRTVGDVVGPRASRVVVEECERVCEEYALTPEAFSNAWDAFTMNEKLTSTAFTESSLDRFKKHLKASSATRRPPPVPPSYTSSTLPRTLPSESQQPDSQPLSQMDLRPAPVLEDTFFAGAAAVPTGDGDRTASGAGVVVALEASSDPRQYPFMQFSLYERAEKLDADLERRRNGLGRDLKVDLDTNVGKPMHESAMAFGRLCTEEVDDAVVDGRVSKLAADTAVLQGTVTSKSPRVRMNLDAAESASGGACALFLGQALAVEGTNPSGKLLSVRKVHRCSAAPALSGSSGPSELLTVMVACGPYTAIDSFGFQALDALIAVAIAEAPDVLILMGPFLAAEHSQIKTLAVDFETFFRATVAAKVKRLSAQSTHVVLLPATSDVVSLYPVIPQPALVPALFPGASADKITLAPNPAVLTIGDKEHQVTVGLCSCDVLKHISRNSVMLSPATEAGEPPIQPDRMAALSEAIVREGSFYPVVPSDNNSEGPVFGVELNQSERLRFPGFTPDVLVFPSDLKYFAKQIPVPSGSEGDAAPAPAAPTSTVVNPGRAVTGRNAGRFAMLSFSAGQRQPKVEVFHL